MKSEFKAKLLQHFLQNKEEKGFTLIELLVVIIIIGILAAIALPSFLNQANKAKQSEARTYVGSANRAQQAYYMEKDTFVTAATSYGNLGLGVATQTANYIYDVNTAGTATAPAVISFSTAVKASAPLKIYSGGVGVATIQSTSEATTLATLCESDKAIAVGQANAAAAMTFSTSAAPACGANYTALGK
jgi:type IV pilus assembly protein PilA